MNQTSILTGARAVIAYLDNQTKAELEESVLENPFFGIARVLLLERYLAKLPRLGNLLNSATVEQGEA